MTFARVGTVTTSSHSPVQPSTAHNDDEGMRLSRRLLLVVLTLMALGATLWTSLRPNLDGGLLAVGWPNPVAAFAWFVLFVALLLQVSSKVKAFAIGIAFLFFWPTPVFASEGIMSLYGQYAMERTTATVTAADKPRERGPAPVTFTYPDGSSERGISLLIERYSTGTEYVAPRVGTTLEVLRDPAGRLPARTAMTNEAEPEGAGRAWLYALPGLLGMLVLGAATASALTRRESFISVAGRKATPDEVNRGAAAAGP